MLSVCGSNRRSPFLIIDAFDLTSSCGSGTLTERLVRACDDATRSGQQRFVATAEVVPDAFPYGGVDVLRM